MHHPSYARRVARALACASFGAGLALAAHAQSPAAEFAVSAAQMKSLGVNVTRLGRPSAVAGMAYPARVTVPVSGEQLLGAPVDGVVEHLFVTGQESVRAGQALLRLASPGFGQLQLKLMEAASAARLSRKALERERALFAEGIIPERRVLEAEAVERNDAARQRQAESELRLAGADPVSIRKLIGGGEPEPGVVLRAREAGRVVGVDVKPGQRVKEGDALVRLANPSELWLEIQVPSDRSVPTAGEVTVPGREGVTAALQSASAIVSDSQTVTLRARVTRGAERLRAGEFVQAQVPFASGPGWVLPLQAVTYQDGKSYAFVRSTKGFVATPVSVLASAGQSVQVSGALREGQDVAVSSVIALKAAWLGKGGGE